MHPNTMCVTGSIGTMPQNLTGAVCMGVESDCHNYTLYNSQKLCNNIDAD